MFDNLFRKIQDFFSDPPGVIIGAGKVNDRLAANDDISLAFFPQINVDTASIAFGMMPLVSRDIDGYTFSGSEGGKKLSGVLSSDDFESVVAYLRAQVDMFGRVIELPEQMGGAGLPFAPRSGPFPDLGTLPE